MSDIFGSHTKVIRPILAFSFLLLLLPLSSISANILQHAYAQTTVTSDQVLNQIHQLDSDLSSQFQLLTPSSMDFDSYSARVWQTQDSSFTFSVDALKGDQSQRQSQFAEWMKTTTASEQSTTISGHPGWLQVYNDYYDVWVNVRWGDGNYFSALAEFSFTIPSTMTGNTDQVNAFKDQKQKDVIAIVNKIDGVLTQHGFYSFEGQSTPSHATTQTNPTNNTQEITGTITSIRDGAHLSISRADGSIVDATVGLVLHKGDTVMALAKVTPFIPEAVIDFGYGKLEVMQSTVVTIGEADLKDNLAKTQLYLKQGSVYQIIDGPIEAKYHHNGIRSDFSVVTPMCSSSIRGSAMFVSFDTTSNSTTVYATQDQAFVQGTSDSQEVAVPANQKVTVGIDGTASSPVSLTADEMTTIPGVQNQPQLKIPSWIKSNAGWWSKGQISDDEFVKGIQFLITNKIMNIPSTQSGSGNSQVIPGWIKSNAGWWSQGQISDDEFVKGIQFLITNGIIVLSPTGSSNTSQVSTSQQDKNNSPIQSNTVQSPTATSQSANGAFQMDKSVYTANGSPADMATISGKVDNPSGGVVVLTITKPDGTTEPINADVTSVGDFRTLIIIDGTFPAGTYTISGNYQGSDLGSTTFAVG